MDPLLPPPGHGLLFIPPLLPSLLLSVHLFLVFLFPVPLPFSLPLSRSLVLLGETFLKLAPLGDARIRRYPSNT